MKTISVYVGSRANYSSAKSIMQAIKSHPKLKLSIVFPDNSSIPVEIETEFLHL